jgi:SAM-dependent methyltransferase
MGNEAQNFFKMNFSDTLLDIGGCDSLLPIRLAAMGHLVTVYDFRRYPERHPNVRVIQGDFLRNELPARSFDIAILVSTLEHIGLGAYGAPQYHDADLRTMRELRRVLGDDGKAILSFPFSDKDGVIPGFERWYSTEQLQRLFDGWFVLNVEFWVPAKKVMGRWVKWKPATAREAGLSGEVSGVPGVACFVLSNRPLSWWGPRGK